MARPLKDGIDYFPLDVNFLKDLKIRKILIACGPQSIAVLISLLCNIYQDEGYYIGWDEDVRFLIADDVGVKESLVHEVVNRAVGVDFFDQELFKKYNILTSIGIQKRYLEATSRRKKIKIKKSFNLVNVSNNLVNVDNNLVNVDKSTQSKVKESKVKERNTDTITDSLILEYKKTYPASWVDEAVSICVSKSKGVSYLDGILKNFEREKKQTSFHNFDGQTSNYSKDDLDEIAKNMRKRRQDK